VSDWVLSVKHHSITPRVTGRYSIFIISNQGGLSGNSRKRKEQWEAKIGLIAKEVRFIVQLSKYLVQEFLLLMSLSLVQIPEVPFHILAAMEHDDFRKPQPGMWNNLISALYSKEHVVFGTAIVVCSSLPLPPPHFPAKPGGKIITYVKIQSYSAACALFVDLWLRCSCRFRTMLLCRRRGWAHGRS
jgi:hypothetical protein